MTFKKIGSKSLRMKNPENQPSLVTMGKGFDYYLAFKPYAYISKACDIPLSFLKWYARENKWEEQREALAKQAQESSVATFRKVQEANLIEVATRQLNLTKQIDDHIERALEKKVVGVRQLKDLSSTLSNTADVSGRIVGLHRLTSQDGSKPLLVQFNMKVNTSGTALPVVSVDAVSSDTQQHLQSIPVECHEFVDIETNPPF